MTEQQRICRRIMDACLREDVRQIRSQGRSLERDGQLWLELDHLGTPLRLPVAECDYMQPLRATASHWFYRSEGQWRQESGHRAWLGRLMAGLEPDEQALYQSYMEEADAAVEQGELCRQSFAEQAEELAYFGTNWGERLLHADQLASFLDHPYYPTARAKFGFSREQLRAYAPEFAPVFELNWLALPAARVTLTGPLPDWWPDVEQVGLAASLAHSHVLLPVHPLTWQQLGPMPADALPAPETFLPVVPTLSVRTLALKDHPTEHLKVPLDMATLGQKNIRLIKPSTLYDGHWFAQCLTRLEQQDERLQGRYRHVDESVAGHLGDDKLYAFLLRRYPEFEPDETLVPVAALCSPLPDGRPYIAGLLTQQGGLGLEDWWQQYCALMAEVHLRLWLKYGIALESNQQNAVLSITPNQPLSLVMKDNDAARLWPTRFNHACPELADQLDELKDARILVDDELALGQMFTTITLQLDLAAVLEGLAEQGWLNREAGYRVLRLSLRRELDALHREGLDTRLAEALLFNAEHQYVKYLLQSGSLLSKQGSGAADINKFYGLSGPNFLRGDT
ncbi:IucA/IucC family protein [Oceanisphaera arctica]|uniref:Short-chain isoprenyl diphosphate synthase n=1 Tax=Oceanisphaera arctica TaxID=641510 RepID=A0A2P5TIM9_9GAMM|nr:IucA/IucC family protein [Oceanisphaera arctica]PPL14636.1 short-chain isoprenyl diphosphate synthase [Oceanisphaera arctica]GHA03587.1 vibrioferrin biosynthesis protein PvsB [Oceanisphaera arctica]